MKSGYKILWTDHALYELQNTINYLEVNWTDKELMKLSIMLEKVLFLISKNPYLFQSSETEKNIRRVIILSFNTLYYRINEDSIEILSFFSNRQNPKKGKFYDK